MGMEYIEETRALLKYELPLNEIIYDFFDALKSRSRGYASFDYELKGYEQSELVKLDILINKEEVDALSFIVHADSAYERGRKMCEKLKEEIPRQLFRDPDPGGYRRQDHRPGDGKGRAQGCAGQVLRRRYHPEEEASGEAEGRQEADAPGGQCGDSAEGLYERIEAG